MSEMKTMSEELTDQEREAEEKAMDDLRAGIRAKFYEGGGPSIGFFTSCGISSLDLIEGLDKAREAMLTGAILIEQAGKFYLMAKTSNEKKS